MDMNEEELKHNPVLTKYAVQDLNVSPKLPFEDNSFHIITNVVSVDYVTKPLDVFKEMCWILKSFRSPLNEFNLAKISANSFSNRCSWTKPISIWTSTSDADHASLAGAYFHYAGGFEPPQGARLVFCSSNISSICSLLIFFRIPCLLMTYKAQIISSASPMTFQFSDNPVSFFLHIRFCLNNMMSSLEAASASSMFSSRIYVNGVKPSA
ncbi:uncharacterized protein LOC126611944 [Malus sylvestris]|uniref:uncharacterized protein LOC126611944 n=1 Tax=Malus sylvestris TaxID=3752 RepID=UPI0021ACF762|nr:uncharacterized protein LOC126611944 [Malus sylvestris]XP_050136208.1 uncharacterized protein LOC126611944 [Malus sylvestris]XP_050136214.1 uncharacterized protein LOC126611944 [Malus sylvestris]